MISSEKAKTRKEAVCCKVICIIFLAEFVVKLYASFHVVPVSQALSE